MVQPSEERQRGDSTHALNRSSDRRVLAKSEMSPRLIVIDGVGAKDAAQVRFAEYYRVIDAFPSHRADQPLDVFVLPRRTGCDWTIANADRPHPLAEGVPVHTVAISDQISRRRVPR